MSEKKEIKKQRIKKIIKEIVSEHIGDKDTISRDNLRRSIKVQYFNETGDELRLSDRKMRDLIESLRSTDIWSARICATLAGGYFIAASRSELMSYLQSDKNRVMNTYRRIRSQRINSIVAFATNDFEAMRQVELFTYDN